MSPASYQTAPPRDVSLCRAGNGTRTRDPNLGKVVLYQLSYSRADHNFSGRTPENNFRFSSPISALAIADCRSADLRRQPTVPVAAVEVEARGIEPLTS